MPFPGRSWAAAPEEIKARFAPAVASAMLFRPQGRPRTRKSERLAKRFGRFSHGMPRLTSAQSLAIAEGLERAPIGQASQQQGAKESLSTLRTLCGRRRC